MADNNNKNTFQIFNTQYGMPVQSISSIENIEYESRRDDYLFWGTSNNYPQFILELRETSPTLAVSIDSKASLSLGDGVEIENKGNVLINRFETLTEIYYKLLYDAWLFGGWAVEVIWNREGTAIQSVYHLPFQNVRAEKIDDEEHLREIEYYYYSEDWLSNKRNKKITKFHTLDPDYKEGRQIFYWTNYTPSNNKIYPVLPWQSGVNSVVLESEIWSFHKKNLDNSLLPNLFISLIGSPTPTEREEIYNELTMAYQGKNGKKLMLSFSDTAEDRPQIEPISNDANSGLYIDVLNLAQQSILTSNQISSPLLLGIQVGIANGFSSNADEIRTATEHMLEFVIKPFIKKMNLGLENVLALKYNEPIKLINKYNSFKPEL
jgi:hypothetical protein